RASAKGWTIDYHSGALADNDAIEDILVFRAQQRRWARAVSQAGLHAAAHLELRSRGIARSAMEWTALLPHATIPLAMFATVCLAGEVLSGTTPSAFTVIVRCVFAVTLVFSPTLLAVILSIKTLHPRDWLARVRLLAFS